MSAVHAVLLVPAAGDPLGLLAAGPCGACPPMAWEDDGKWLAGEPPEYERDGSTGYFDPPRRVALVLAWEGKPVWQGCQALVEEAGVDEAKLGQVLRVAMAGALNGARVESGEATIGTLVLLDERGREVTP